MKLTTPEDLEDRYSKIDRVDEIINRIENHIAIMDNNQIAHTYSARIFIPGNVVNESALTASEKKELKSRYVNIGWSDVDFEEDLFDGIYLIK